MAITAEIVEEKQLEGGEWRCFVDFTDSETGGVVQKTYRWDIPLRADREAAANAIAADFDGTQLEHEQENLLLWVREGKPKDDFPLVHQTQQESRVFLAEYLLNLMRDEPGDLGLDRDNRAFNLAMQAVLFEEHASNAYFVSALGLGAKGWTAGEIGTARSKAIALRNSWLNIDHGKPEILP